MELRNKYVKREDVKKAEKPKPVHSKKAPLIAGLVVSTALAVGACTTKDDKPVENKNFVPYTIRTPQAGEPMTVKEGDRFVFHSTPTFSDPPTISWKIEKIRENGVEIAFRAASLFEEAEFKTRVVVPYGKSTRAGLNIGKKRLEIKAQKGKNPKEAVVTLETSVISGSEKTNLMELCMSELEIKTIAKSVKVGDTIPYIEEDLDNGESLDISLKVVSINEKEVELAWEAETVFEEGYFKQSVVLPYGKSIKMGDEILAPRLTALKSNNSEEALVTVEMMGPKSSE